ncbi:c-type cytochrome [Pendulispora albinea]|uniref:Cytochrome c n=1 Tax=Pendulispora albinea TaxID=2741071 RepID=A0ABZ2LXQ2_9BACT
MARPLLLSSYVFLCSAALFLLMNGCGDSNSQDSGAPPTSNTDDGETQAARGAQLYGAHCASCHGPSGEGSGEAPPLVGKEALPLHPRSTQRVRTNQFHTALDVAQFAVRTMPPKSPGSLKETEYWDIIAFDLKANGVSVAGVHIDATSTANIKLR